MPSSLFGAGTPQTPVGPQQNQPQVNPQIQSMLQAYRSGQNPIQSMLYAKNPQMMQVMELVNSMGGDPKAAFYKLAAQKGVDPNSILSMLK